MMNKVLYLLSFIGAFLSPIKDVLVVVCVLILIDLIMGLIASKKLKIPITSKKLSKTVIKLFVYQLLIISSFITETYLVSSLPLLTLTLSFLGVVELLSISESFVKITGLPFIKYLKRQVFNMTRVKEGNKGVDIGSTGEVSKDKDSTK